LILLHISYVYTFFGRFNGTPAGRHNDSDIAIRQIKIIRGCNKTEPGKQKLAHL